MYAIMIVKGNRIDFTIRNGERQVQGAEPFTWCTFEAAKRFVRNLANDYGVKSVELIEDYE